MTQYIPELKRDLGGRLLAIWNGTSGLAPAQEEAYRQLWRVEAGRIPASAATAVPNRSAPCIFRGDPTGATVDCPTCRGSVSLKVLACSVFGGCTAAKEVAGLACCATCRVPMKS